MRLSGHMAALYAFHTFERVSRHTCARVPLGTRLEMEWWVIENAGFQLYDMISLWKLIVQVSLLLAVYKGSH